MTILFYADSASYCTASVTNKAFYCLKPKAAQDMHSPSLIEQASKNSGTKDSYGEFHAKDEKGRVVTPVVAETDQNRGFCTS